MPHPDAKVSVGWCHERSFKFCYGGKPPTGWYFIKRHVLWVVKDCFFNLVGQSGVKTVLTQGTFSAITCDWNSFGKDCVTVNTTMGEVVVVLAGGGDDGVLVGEAHCGRL